MSRYNRGCWHYEGCRKHLILIIGGIKQMPPSLAISSLEFALTPYLFKWKAPLINKPWNAIIKSNFLPGSWEVLPNFHPSHLIRISVQNFSFLLKMFKIDEVSCSSLQAVQTISATMLSHCNIKQTNSDTSKHYKGFLKPVQIKVKNTKETDNKCCTEE